MSKVRTNGGGGGGAGEGSKGGAPSEVETQLAEMHRKYRIMEGNRKSYSEDSQVIIRRQRATIEKLKNDNISLKNEIAGHEADTAPVSTAIQKEMAKLQDLADGYTRKMEIERRRLEEIEQQCNLAAVKVLDQRAKLGGVNATKENDHQIQKQIKVLENRLDKALIKFNEALANNKVLREEIDHLRRERVTFDEIYKKLEKELHEKKKEMANVIEISNIAYEARDQAHNEIAALKAQADKEQSAFESEWKELGKLLEADKKMKEMMNKNKTYVGHLSIEDEAKLRKKVIKGGWNLAKDKAHTDVAAKAVENYDEAFAQIQAATGITDVEELVTSFINAEDGNFSLFNYANELNQEMERLEEQVGELNAEVAKFSSAGESTDNQRKKFTQDLAGRMERLELKAQNYETKFANATRTVNALKVGIASIFTKTGCATPAAREALGDVGVTDANMLDYLAFIEQRANEIIRTYNAAQAQLKSTADGVSGGGVLGVGPCAPTGQATILIVPPSTAEAEHVSDGENSEDDIEDRPLTRDELESRTLRNLNKAGAKGAQRRRHHKK
mmetsp:Transcript_2665/g.3018  ORF Transcript_2665/g.3018 Transcript_2665/m.3018 type:complete len:559 (-) Transcript_2665:802-2478(-)|eukprot:CAMPEP_0197851912 /NCGR_PEP_ID=MMETSP1438-20131217/19222_1 /TAXON_ID=1461541 /ORGANISM="Pterosperma sp., Strain CCMP1384" /LENGTH=558 /DNA_ID=CAMNT_0043465711 /DNA_START=205 /DNA_END=1881 /DNA_ORIENTATION=+